MDDIQQIMESPSIELKQSRRQNNLRSEFKPETEAKVAQPVARFIQLVDGGRLPRRADRSVGGTLPVRALRYCEPVCAASSFGWHVFLPCKVRFLFDGHEVLYQLPGDMDWSSLRTTNYPSLEDAFDAAAPEEAQGYAPPFLTASVQTGSVQVWPGLMARTLPGWSLLVRPVANLSKPSAYEMFEGIIETDEWFGPLFTNIRLARTGVPIELDDDVPFMHLQPVRKETYSDQLLSRYAVEEGLDALTTDDWERYAATVVRPNKDPNRRRGAYAARVRKAGARLAPEEPAA